MRRQKFNWRLILNILGTLLLFNGAFMLFCLPVSVFYWEEDWIALLIASGITATVGGAVRMTTGKQADKELKRRDGFLVVSLGWVTLSLFGSLPYLIDGSIPVYPDAFFEAMSGFTTTGATILTDIESLPKGILLWRSLTQWIGGMGIIVLAVAILPILGIGGMQLYVAEAPGISPDKLKPRIQDTAKRLWYIYVGLTGLEFVLLAVGGMNLYDAFCHSLTTMATGGFSPKNASIAHYDSAYIQYVIIIFMFMAGTSFSLTYFLLKGQYKKVLHNEEFRYYLGVVLGLILIISLAIYFHVGSNFEKAFRDAAFQIVSLISTTGFITADYTAFTPLVTLVCFLTLFIGASAGSTAGGVKIIRHVILFKNTLLELKRQIHPSAILPVRFNGKAITQDITYNILAFFIIYISSFVLGTFILSALGVDFMTALGAVATSLGNVGPGLGNVGPVNNFAGLPDAVKWILAFLMLIGRLELFTVLLLFTPYFWKTHT